MARTAVRLLLLALTVTGSLLPYPALAANKDLVILNSERWIDTVKGTVKNVSADRAEEVVLVVRFFGEARSHAGPRRRKPAPRQGLGQQTVKLPSLDPGQEVAFEVEIAETHRGATSFTFEPHAIWAKASQGRYGRR